MGVKAAEAPQAGNRLAVLHHSRSPSPAAPTAPLCSTPAEKQHLSQLLHSCLAQSHFPVQLWLLE